MKERLEQFIHSNREAFDDQLPPSLNWEKVNNRIITKEKRAKAYILSGLKFWVAALALAGIATVLFLIVENNKLKSDLTASQQRLEQQDLQKQPTIDYDREINQFTQIVAKKQNQLSGISREYPSLYKSFTSDINELNKEFENLKLELNSVPEQDEVLDAMIQNLKLQAELLNEQLQIIHQLKSTKKNTNEKTAIVI